MAIHAPILLPTRLTTVNLRIEAGVQLVCTNRRRGLLFDDLR